MNTAVAKKQTPADEGKTEEVAPMQRIQLDPTLIRFMEHGRSWYFIKPPADHSLEQVLDLRYLWHAHDRFKPGDRVEIMHPYFLFEVTILVREIDFEAQAIIGFYTVRDLSREELRVPDLSAAFVKYMGGPHKHAVFMPGNQLLQSGFDTQGEADAWLRKKQARGN